MSFAFIFPGQGSQSLKMMDSLKNLSPVKNIFEIAKEILNVDFLKMLEDETPENINKTVNTQPLMLIAGYATYLAWSSQTDELPSIIAGHSLGEWTALVVGGVISFEDALKLVLIRANAMQNVVAPGVGAMAAVLGLDDDKVIEVCNEVEKETGSVVAGVNFNSIGQVVIAGDKSAVDLALIKLKENGARKVQILPVSVPSHCRLMKPAADILENAIKAIPFSIPKIQILQNVDALVHNDADEVKKLLVKQLYSPVLWSKTINNIVNMNIINIVECGPGKVLSGLNKRISDKIVSHNIQNDDDIERIKTLINEKSRI